MYSRWQRFIYYFGINVDDEKNDLFSESNFCNGVEGLSKKKDDDVKWEAFEAS